MPQLRRDPVIGRWVIISPERAMRPGQFQPGPLYPPNNRACPFCEGNEKETPPEIRAVRSGTPPNSPGWRMRVVPNKFPALRIEGNLDKRAEGVYDSMNGIGAHEVIIETPRHVFSLTDLDENEVRQLLWMYKERVLDLRNDRRMNSVMIFKNVGELAGASLEHSHSQIIATPITPIRLVSEIDRCRQYYDFHGRCLLCDLVDQELRSGTRTVHVTDEYLVVEPYASRFPFETWILPRIHQSHFEHVDDSLLLPLARGLRDTILRIEKTVGNPPYNFLIHSAPLPIPEMDHYHWHFEILPRLTRVAGFEWGTGFYINPLPPEEAAEYLRTVEIPPRA